MIFYGILKRRSNSRLLVILLACVVLIYIQISTKQYFYIPITFLLVLAVFFKKEHIVSEEGVDIVYNLFAYRSVNRWTWDEVDALQPDFIKERPNVRLSFGKGSVIRSFLFTAEDADSVMALAKRVNPNMYVDDFTAEDQEKALEKKRRQEEELRRRKAEYRKSKRKRK